MPAPKNTAHVIIKGRDPGEDTGGPRLFVNGFELTDLVLRDTWKISALDGPEGKLLGRVKMTCDIVCHLVELDPDTTDADADDASTDGTMD